jgi:hypothetical protein
MSEGSEFEASFKIFMCASECGKRSEKRDEIKLFKLNQVLTFISLPCQSRFFKTLNAFWVGGFFHPPVLFLALRVRETDKVT